MPQYFPPNVNSFVRWSILAGGAFLVALLVALPIYARTVNNAVGVPVEQPIAFAHNLHVAQLGIDCRYCHSTVEVAGTANIPSSHVCMTCHSQIRVGAPQLEALWLSWEQNVPIRWNRVHDVPSFAYFDHSAHLTHGVGCSTCHGRVDQMAGIWKNEPLTMGWCMECHRAPERFLRPRSEVFDMAYQPPRDQLTLGRELVVAYGVNVEKLIQCSTCHR